MAASAFVRVMGRQNDSQYGDRIHAGQAYFRPETDNAGGAKHRLVACITVARRDKQRGIAGFADSAVGAKGGRYRGCQKSSKECATHKQRGFRSTTSSWAEKNHGRRLGARL